ncbi:MAG: DUF4876 domain-containing protein [Bacteroidales bacterium]|nr:DUF4876 domain-containing protein [Bacteroidales bacterium]MBQ9202591.1 DUF4876 domain-containing protein [Bacteroidales bacterium]
MKKQVFFLGLLCVLFAFSSCEKKVAKKYVVTVTVSADGESISDLSDFSLTAQNESGVKLNPEEADSAKFIFTYNLVAGTYTFTGFASSDEFNFNGTQRVIVSEDTETSVVLTPSAKQASGIIFKEIYSYGVASWYFKDAFYELVNNSDEVQYLDGIILACVDRGFGSDRTDWMDEEGNIPADFYPLANYVMQFPGNGTEHPVQPGESILIAAQAYNHNTYDEETQTGRQLGENDAESPAGDLSKADWQLWIPTQETNYYNPSIPTLNVISNQGGGIMFMPAVFGQPLLLAKLPEGTTAEAYVNDSSNYHSYAGSTKAVLGIPVDCVIDAVDIQRWGENSIVKVFHPAQDAGYTMANGNDEPMESFEDWSASPLYCGKSLRRKCTMVTTDRAYFKDTNNSTNDFIMGGQVAVPRRTFTEPDAE